ncbi:MAG: isocitrate lyase/phosphoenolpyruvate mutase family protein, partial [bacterium]|nr:isocitrate lyase/phosphoenolpyruvate mutase family protein [bacterium]
MLKTTQIQKAKDFLALHHDPKLLVLPNIWDPGGARLLEHLGYPAVATASAAVAYSLGHDDGERITFDVMVDVIQRIASAVSVPVSADIEGGYGEDPLDVFNNVRRIVQAGAVGINIEDSFSEGGPLRDASSQCERIRQARNAARGEKVPIVINARMDVFIGSDTATDDQMSEAVSRARAYLDAGADCIYPITLGRIKALKELLSQIRAPINVYANAKAAPMRDLEKAGISRLSLGP